MVPRLGVGVVIDSNRGLVYRDGATVYLTLQEFEIFYYLWASRKPRTTLEIYNNIFQLRLECDRPKNPEKFIRTLISRIRTKLRTIGMVMPDAYTQKSYTLSEESSEKYEAARAASAGSIADRAA